MTLNARWHTEHVMPRNATPAERLAWHTSHAKRCGCRPFTSEMRTKLEAAVAAAKTTLKRAPSPRTD